MDENPTKVFICKELAGIFQQGLCEVADNTFNLSQSQDPYKAKTWLVSLNSSSMTLV
jgi:hypothetical protein